MIVCPRCMPDVTTVIEVEEMADAAAWLVGSGTGSGESAHGKTQWVGSRAERQVLPLAIAILTHGAQLVVILRLGFQGLAQHLEHLCCISHIRVEHVLKLQFTSSFCWLP